MTIQCRCGECGAVLHTTNANPLNDQIERLRALVKELANDLESEVEGHYYGVKDHPAMAHKYERDLDPVRRARKVLEEDV